jgi:predicted RNA-binding Zn-ribbon protein involved in translation (DUF1610 family)
MKIINGPLNLPRLPENWWIGKTSTCDKCGTQIKLDESDSPRQSINSQREYVHFNCPYCGNSLCFGEDREAKVSTAKNQIIDTTIIEEEPKKQSFLNKLLSI